MLFIFIQPVVRIFLAYRVFFSIFLVSYGYSAIGQAADYQTHPQAQRLMDEVARIHDFDRNALQNIFARVERDARVLALMGNTAESRAQRGADAWRDYQQRFITADAIRNGRRYLSVHRQWFARAVTDYGVPPEIIAAILGIETHYGNYTGDFMAVNALATLAFEHPSRGAFFRRELIELLLLARAAQRDIFSFSSSYAGALGVPQFLPSSYRAYAIDFDQDQHADIWNNPADIIASVGHFLQRAGWSPGLPVAARAKAKKDTVADYLSTDHRPHLPLHRLFSAVSPPLGWQEDTMIAMIAMPGDAADEYWLVTRNFSAIMRYNPRYSYALTVYLLSTALSSDGTL